MYHRESRNNDCIPAFVSGNVRFRCLIASVTVNSFLVATLSVWSLSVIEACLDRQTNIPTMTKATVTKQVNGWNSTFYNTFPVVSKSQLGLVSNGPFYCSMPGTGFAMLV